MVQTKGYTMKGFDFDKEHTELSFIVVNDDNSENMIKINYPDEYTGNFTELCKKYGKVSPYHNIDENGEFGLYQHQSFHPFFMLPPNLRKAEQWESDEYCFNKPDDRYINYPSYVDMNALVYKSWLDSVNTTVVASNTAT